MTLTVADPLPPMVLGQYANVGVTITGPSPVHAVLIDLLSDGQPAWYYTPFDARSTVNYSVGPFKRKGRSELVARAVDEMGCEISNGVRLYVTVQ
jgi:hypothetical protein